MATATNKPFTNIDSGTYYGEITIEIGCTSPNAIIYYTLDGTTPTITSSSINANTEITISEPGNYLIRCFAKTPYNDPSQIIDINYILLENQNLRTTNTSDNILDRIPYTLEPTNSYGPQLYVDLTQFVSQKMRDQEGFMELLYLFQDYINNGFRLIPYYYKELVSTNSGDGCLAGTTKINYEYLEPYNHDISMIMDYENASQDLEQTIAVEQYDRNRDLSTFAIDDQLIEDYKKKYSGEYVQYVDETGTTHKSKYYYTMKYYKNKSFINLSDVEYPFNMFLSTIDSSDTNNSELEPQLMLKSEALNKLNSFSGKVSVILYYCGYDDFVDNFNYSGSFKVNEYFYPKFDNRVDNYNIEDIPHINSGEYLSKNDFIQQLSSNTDRFSITIELNSISQLSTISISDFAMSILLEISNITQYNEVPSNIPLMAPRFLKVKMWQDPKIFYDHFSYQNANRIDDKRSTVLEKIRSIAYMNDPDVIDYEYIEFIASEMGYNIDLAKEDIENNSVLTTKADREEALRMVLKNLPNFYKIKCTKNGLESLLLSFGIVGEIIYLHTIGNEQKQGYVDFIDSRLIEGFEDSQYTNDSKTELTKAINKGYLSNTVISDWFPSPHFRIELDLLEQNLRLDKNKLGIQLINKAVKRTKPINTVFQGFYGKMSSKFAELFIHAPKGLMKASIRSVVNNTCETTDVWSSRCIGNKYY